MFSRKVPFMYLSSETEHKALKVAEIIHWCTKLVNFTLFTHFYRWSHLSQFTRFWGDQPWPYISGWGTEISLYSRSARSDWQRQQRALKCGGSRSCKTSRMASSLFSCCIYLSTFPLSVWDHLLPDLCPNALCLKSSGVGKICTSCHFMSAPLFLWWTPSSSSSSPSAPSTDIFTLRLYQSS